MSFSRFMFFTFATLVAGLISLNAGSQLAPQQAASIDADALLETVRTLSSPSFEGRRTGTSGNAQARAWIVERFGEIGLAPSGENFQMPFKFTRPSTSSAQGTPATTAGEGVNIVGTCRGRGAKDDGVMVITAHYDHLGVGDGVIYHGADDNASGIAVLLALARHCRSSPWTHDTVFAALDAEELGLLGARAFLATPPVPEQRLALNVNMDMVSRSARREVYVAGTFQRPALRPVLDPVAARAPIKVLFGHDKPKELAGGRDDWTLQSDHGPFHAAGIPFVYFGVEDHADYHKPTDTADKIDKTFFAQVATTVLDAVTALDRAIPLR
jgi:Zn-dependent M28 family amino/carboxypeptidase